MDRGHHHHFFPAYPFYDFYDYLHRPDLGMDDEDIRENVLSNIAADPFIPEDDKENIDAAVVDGFVTLMGKVRRRHSKFAAFGDAFWSAGVIDVTNNIEVEKKPREKAKGEKK